MFRTSVGRLSLLRELSAPPRPLPTRSIFSSALRSNFRATLPRRVEQPSLPSFREEVARTRPQESFAEKVGRPGIGRQILFAFAGSCVALSYAAFYTNIETGIWINRLMPASESSWLNHSVTNADLKRAHRVELVRKWRAWFVAIQDEVLAIPKIIRPWVAAGYAAFMNPYGNSSEGKRMCWKICLFNAAIWVAWKIKRFQVPMARAFTHHPLSGLSYTLLTSMFSHKSFIHLLCNCLALESFGSAAYLYLVREQDKAAPEQLEVSASYHFLGFFLSAGLFSGLVSHIVSTKFLYPRVVAQLSAPAAKTETWAAAVAASSTSTAAAKAAPKPILPSLGASGAIYASVTLTALAFPESQVSLIIPPSYPIDIQTGVGALVLLDIVGVMRGWRMFDHWAHLGGAAFGGAYYYFGPTAWQHFRRIFNPTTRAPVSA